MGGNATGFEPTACHKFVLHIARWPASRKTVSIHVTPCTSCVSNRNLLAASSSSNGRSRALGLGLPAVGPKSVPGSVSASRSLICFRAATASGELRSVLSLALLAFVAMWLRPAKCRRNTGPAGAGTAVGGVAVTGFSRQPVAATTQPINRTKANRLIGVLELPKPARRSKSKSMRELTVDCSHDASILRRAGLLPDPTSPARPRRAGQGRVSARTRIWRIAPPPR